jgi:predicted acylesterase/phospholipase RssA
MDFDSCFGTREPPPTPKPFPRSISTVYGLLDSDGGKLGLHEQEINYKEDARWDGHPIEALAFEGGGTKGATFGGALKRLEEAKLLAGITFVAGTSAGSQVASLVAFGFSADEVTDILANAPWDKLLDDSFGCFRDMYRLMTEYGFYRGDFLQDFLDTQYQKKSGKPLATFEELYALTGTHLKVGVISIKEREFKMLDHLTNPEMPVAVAVRASSALPMIFTAVRYGGDTYVDGGLLGNLPTFAFPGKKLLGLDLVSNEDWVLLRGQTLNLPKGPAGHFGTLSSMVINNAQLGRKHAQQIGVAEANAKCAGQQGPLSRPLARVALGRPKRTIVDVIELSTGDAPTLDRELTPERINLMLAAGYIAVDKYLTGLVRRSSKDELALGPKSTGEVPRHFIRRHARKAALRELLGWS